MKLKELASLIDGKIVAGQINIERNIETAFASDLMSDVLTINCDNMLLITGLVNIQAIRTAEMSDICCIVFARNKQVTSEMVALAEETNIVLIQSPYSLFRVSGILYQAGIDPVF